MQPNLTSFVVLCIVLIAMGFGMGFLVAFLEFRGPLGDGEAERTENAKKMRNNMQSDQIAGHLSALTESPNTAGTASGEANTEHLRQFLEDQGFSVRVDSYDVLLSFPDRSTSVNQAMILDGNKEVIRRLPQTGVAARLAREAADDNTTSAEETREDDVAYPYIAYSASGKVEGDVTYVNYGEQKDFDWLPDPSVSGKILLARYGKNSIAEKVELAEENGAVGMLLFADPADFAPENTTFPDNWWLPPDAAHWGTANARGDPLTPDVPATEGAHRRKVSEAGLPTIPVYSINYDDAGALLRIMKGPLAPTDWQGSLSPGYKVGPGFNNPQWKVKMDITMDNAQKTISNVIGVMEGTIEPDRYVMIGGAKDSWGTGGIGATSGIAVLMEVARTLGQLKKEGWEPHRTVMLCGWDAQEFGDVGLTEWLEEYASVLSGRVVGYVDVGNAVEGTHAPKAVASAILQEALDEAAKRVPNPCEQEVSAGRDHVYDTLEFRSTNQQTDDEFRSSTSTIQEMLGAAISEVRYTYDEAYDIPHHPLYHTKYDTYEYVETMLDPDFKYHLAVSRWVGEIALLLADKPLLSYDAGRYVQILNAHSEALTSGIQELDDSIQQETADNLDRYNEAADVFRGKTIPEFQEHAKAADPTKPIVMRQLNDRVMRLERTFSKPAAEDEESMFAVATVEDYIQPLNATSIPDDEKATLVEELTGYISRATLRIEHATAALQKPTEF